MSLLLCLQFWPGDIERARELTRLWTSMPNGGAHVMLSARYDCADSMEEWMADLVPWCGVVHSVRSQYAKAGWPAGCNWLAVSTIEHAAAICADHDYDAVWLLEGDAVPIVPNWIDRFSDEFRHAEVEAMGAYMDGPDIAAGPHINGNMLLSGDPGFLRDMADVLKTIDLDHPRRAWDVEIWRWLWHRRWQGSVGIFNCWGSRTIDSGAVAQWRGRGVSLIHGVKDDSCLRAAREQCVSTT